MPQIVTRIFSLRALLSQISRCRPGTDQSTQTRWVPQVSLLRPGTESSGPFRLAGRLSSGRYSNRSRIGGCRSRCSYSRRSLGRGFLALHRHDFSQFSLGAVERRKFRLHGQRIRLAALDAASAEGALARIVGPAVGVAAAFHFNGCRGAGIGAGRAANATPR